MEAGAVAGLRGELTSNGVGPRAAFVGYQGPHGFMIVVVESDDR